MLGFSLIEKRRGSVDNGSMKLTDEGVRFITLYHTIFRMSLILKKNQEKLKNICYF
ncbi:MAG: hypothetical protein WCK02_08080 [Bacteroidota bacterium]